MAMVCAMKETSIALPQAPSVSVMCEEAPVSLALELAVQLCGTGSFSANHTSAFSHMTGVGTEALRPLRSSRRCMH